jgi:alpha-D-xyloside xylohydrolase
MQTVLNRLGHNLTPVAKCLFGVFCFTLSLAAAPAPARMIGELVDVSQDFQDRDSTYFVAGPITKFDAATGAGELTWQRYVRQPSLSFNKLDTPFVRGDSTEFPASQYDRDPKLPFEISFIDAGTVRLRFATRATPLKERESLMLAGKLPKSEDWKMTEADGNVTYTSSAGRVEIIKKPWQIRFYDAAGKLLTQTQSLKDPDTFSAPMPFSFVRRARDLGHSIAASFRLAPDEKIFGCGESFTRLDKRGQKVILYVRDAMGAQSQRMYKPIPFFLSSRGYGMFVHTSTPTTFDFGQDFDQSNVIYTGDEELDLFIFLGKPKQVLEEYTAVTGRSPVPPLWSFGLWMSRITYNSEAQVRDVAKKLREHKIPADVIHLDTGWFETDWQCDFKFAKSRFDDPAKMMSDLKKDGFHISMWQLPYFTSKNALFPEAAEKGYFVKSFNGQRPAEDGIIDMSNPAAQAWYEGLLTGLLKLNVGAIKVDFGEDAPLDGIYASGRTGWYEHNLYPLRYNKIVGDLTERLTGDHVIWARSAWAGSQRYPLHWGGDAENTDSAMAATLRAGLSFGLSGFTYWSHDAGGFVGKAPRDLYRRWLPFSALSSHTRCHGAPPREPWEYDEAFTTDFRNTMDLRYSLLPYIYAEARHSSDHGYPMVRALFFEFPDDPTSWLIEDEYMFGSNLLVAPLFAEGDSRNVYLPPGEWIDYQTGESYDGGKWHEIKAGTNEASPVPIVLLARAGAAIPVAAVAQSTKDVDWDNLELRVFAADDEPVAGHVALPDGRVHDVKISRGADGKFQLAENPLEGDVTWKITEAARQ